MSIVGSISNRSLYIIRGWARYTENLDPLEVKLLINDKHVATTVANEFRQDLIDAGVHPEGTCGFRFYTNDLPFELPVNCKIEVKAGPYNWNLSNTPFYPKIPKTYFSDNISDTFCFIHIPKTAGTSFRLMLYKNFRQSSIFFNACDLEKNNDRYPDYLDYIKHTPDTFAKIKLLVGHFPFAVSNSIPGKVKTMCFLRNPIDRALSQLSFYPFYFNEFEGQSLEQIFEQKKKEFNNMQVRYLADKNIEDTPYFSDWNYLDDKGLELAKENLESCDFVGLTERFRESFSLATKTFGWKPQKVQKVNTMNVDYKKQFSESLKNSIKEEVQYDLELYQFAQQLFKKRLHKKRTYFL